MYKMELKTKGENVLAQKILFSKGYQWMSGGAELRYTRSGLFLRIRGGRISRGDLKDEGRFRRLPDAEIGFKELMALPSLEEE